MAIVGLPYTFKGPDVGVPGAARPAIWQTKRVEYALLCGMAWTYLTVAGLFEIGWAIGLKYTDGFTRLLPSLWTIASMILSIILLGLALKTLPVGTAYAVWTGIGAVGTAALGIYLCMHRPDPLRYHRSKTGHIGCVRPYT